jgi:hypothetical protein
MARYIERASTHWMSGGNTGMQTNVSHISSRRPLWHSRSPERRSSASKMRVAPARGTPPSSWQRRGHSIIIIVIRSVLATQPVWMPIINHRRPHRNEHANRDITPHRIQHCDQSPSRPSLYDYPILDPTASLPRPHTLTPTHTAARHATRPHRR